MLFNNSGELNSDKLKETLRIISEYARMLEKNDMKMFVNPVPVSDKVIKIHAEKLKSIIENTSIDNTMNMISKSIKLPASFTGADWATSLVSTPNDFQYTIIKHRDNKMLCSKCKTHNEYYALNNHNDTTYVCYDCKDKT